MNYLDLEVEELASNESFLNWYFKRTHQDVKLWDELISSHPEIRTKVEEAIVIIQNLNHTLSGDENLANIDLWDRLEQHFKLESSNSPGDSTGKSSNIGKVLAVAASVLLVAVGFLWVYSPEDKFTEHITDFGETKSITLPDNSVVTLNSNSSLRYKKSFIGEAGDRRVWLKGEAYFSVVTTQDRSKFLVFTPDQVVVQVLGTEFNVKYRKSGTKIVLNSGKISLNIKEKPQQIFMEPGELVSIPRTSSDFIKKPVNTDLYTSWKCKLFVFDDTPFSEVISLLEENYGLEVDVIDNSILDQKVSGSVPSDNIKLLMDGLSESFGLTIQLSQNTVKIRKNN